MLENAEKSAKAVMSNRKIMKPLMERKRRARINACLTELKTLLQDTLEREGCNHNKIEKADILETTVKHLRRLHQEQKRNEFISPLNTNKYKAGYVECVGEVSRYLSLEDGVDAELRVRMLNYLAARMNQNTTCYSTQAQNRTLLQQKTINVGLYSIPKQQIYSPLQANTPQGCPSSPMQSATVVSPVISMAAVPGIGILKVSNDNVNNIINFISQPQCLNTQQTETYPATSPSYAPLVVSIPNDVSPVFISSQTMTSLPTENNLLTIAHPSMHINECVARHQKSKDQRMWRPW